MVAQIVNSTGTRLVLRDIAERVEVEPVVAYSVLDQLPPHLLRLRVAGGSTVWITDVSPLLARQLD